MYTRLANGEKRLMNLLNNLRGKNSVSIVQDLSNDEEIYYSGKSPVNDYTLLIIQKTART